MVRTLAWLICLVPLSALAESKSTAGLSFSDELGGVRLLSVSGSGTRNDPIVLVEEIAGAGPAVLVVRNERAEGATISPALGFLSLAMVKIIANRGPWSWSGFDLELRRVPDRPSGYTDGLSFDQPRNFARAAASDRFALSQQDDEPFDRIRFDGGRVDPAQNLRLDFDIVDANGATMFYLVQRPVVLFARFTVEPPRGAIGGDVPCPTAGSPFDPASRISIGLRARSHPSPGSRPSC